jgi:hypothetical protein
MQPTGQVGDALAHGIEFDHGAYHKLDSPRF